MVKHFQEPGRKSMGATLLYGAGAETVLDILGFLGTHMVVTLHATGTWSIPLSLFDGTWIYKFQGPLLSVSEPILPLSLFFFFLKEWNRFIEHTYKGQWTKYCLDNTTFIFCICKHDGVYAWMCMCFYDGICVHKGACACRGQSFFYHATLHLLR